MKIFMFKILIAIIVSINGKEIYLFNFHTILSQEFYYNKTERTFSYSFIDFNDFTIYKINKEELRSICDRSKNFTWLWDSKEENKPYIKVNCISERNEENKIDIYKQPHIKFDFDYILIKYGGILSYILILFGFFNLSKGFIYYNCSTVFYSAFGFFSFSLELFEILEIKGKLKRDGMGNIFFYMVLIFLFLITILYGISAFYSDMLKYIAFGLLDGLILDKLFFYLIAFFLHNKNVEVDLFYIYLIPEIIFILIFIGIFLYFKNNHTTFTIISTVVIGVYGIIKGINILVGGVPFIPYLILLKEYKEEEMFNKIMDNNSLFFCYLITSVLLAAVGFHSNRSKYNELKLRMKRISQNEK